MTLLGKAHADPLLRGAAVSETIVHMGELEFFPRAELKSNGENWCYSSWSKFLTPTHMVLSAGQGKHPQRNGKPRNKVG